MHADYFPHHPPLYDIHKTYQENVEYGPFFSHALPTRTLPPKEKWIDFLGFKVASPLGVAAGPLLTARWIKLAAALGYDIPIYKTIRSRQHPAHPLPNMVFVDTKGDLTPSDSTDTLQMTHTPPTQIQELAVTNSFGMPSQSRDFLAQDIARANSSLKEGQVMVVSIVGTGDNSEAFLQDFVDTARFAKDAGAKIIEANFSCPNVSKKEGSLYLDPDLVFTLGKQLVQAIHPLPLIIKVGLFPNTQKLKEVLHAAAKARIQAVSGINTISRTVLNANGEYALGKSRATSGICGGPIRTSALHFVQEASRINKQEKLGLTIIGVGGITLPEHIDHFLEKGADIAMTATGMMWDPYLAAKYHRNHSGGQHGKREAHLKSL